MKQTGNVPAFQPSEAEHLQRCELQKILTAADWPEAVMDWVFYRDHPGVPLVMRLLDDDNDPEDVLQLLMRFDDFPPVPAANPDSLRFGDNRRQRPPGFKKPRRK